MTDFKSVRFSYLHGATEDSIFLHICGLEQLEGKNKSE